MFLLYLCWCGVRINLWVFLDAWVFHFFFTWVMRTKLTFSCLTEPSLQAFPFTLLLFPSPIHYQALHIVMNKLRQVSLLGERNISLTFLRDFNLRSYVHVALRGWHHSMLSLENKWIRVLAS